MNKHTATINQRIRVTFYETLAGGEFNQIPNGETTYKTDEVNDLMPEENFAMNKGINSFTNENLMKHLSDYRFNTRGK